MIVYIGDKWFDTDKLTEIEHYSSLYDYYVTENGNFIKAMRVHYADQNPYALVQKDSDEYQKLQKYINPNPENEL